MERERERERRVERYSSVPGAYVNWLNVSSSAHNNRQLFKRKWVGRSLARSRLMLTYDDMVFSDFRRNLLWNCYNRPLQCIRFVCARFRMTREEEEKIELSICIKCYVSMCLAYNFLWDVMLNGILYIYNAGILYSRLTHIHLFVSFARFNSYIYTHTRSVPLFNTSRTVWLCLWFGCYEAWFSSHAS